MTEAPVEQPWDLETAISSGHWDRLELDRAAVDLREALAEVWRPVLEWLSKVLAV